MLTVSIISIKVLPIFLSLYNSNFPDSSAGKSSTCNAGDPSLIAGLGKSPGEGIVYSLQYSWASLVAQLVKTACNAGDLDLIPRLGRSPGEGNGYPLHTQASILSWKIPRTV